MLAATHQWQIVLAIIGAAGVILAAVLPILIRTQRHARGAYDAVNRVDEIVEPGGVDSKTLNLRQMVEQGFEANMRQHADLHQSVGGLHEEVRSVRADLREHAEDEAVHAWKKK